MKISINNISRYYNKKLAIDNFSWEIDFNKNNVFALIGPNGAGKTTILKVISGIYYFKSGNINQDLSSKDYPIWARDNISFLQAGDRGIRFRNSVYDNVRYYGALKGINPQKTIDLYNRYSNILSMEEFKNRNVGDLSTGEVKKASLLCCLCSDSKIIILDEPSEGLDIDSKIKLQKIIGKISEETNTKFIISTHDLDFISDLADNYTFISKGKNTYQYSSRMNIEEIKQKFLEVNSLI
ncbi:MAG: ABC transporter ATP-binding protein [Peptoniphilaceae bacterium]|nr:ABC transporter ATP-binding protein [Peptoniphilaceae bacterium]MDY6019708.1 ABC transporter ATP-binding protein [Anaerococcus sp.]